MADELKIDYGDGVSALDRTMRALVMMLDGAIAELLKKGYERDHDMITIEQSEDVLPSWVVMRGVRMFEVGFAAADESPMIEIRGTWLRKPRRRTFIGKFFSRKHRA